MKRFFHSFTLSLFMLTMMSMPCLAQEQTEELTEQNAVAIYHIDGEVSYFAFGDKPEVTYTATDLLLTSTQVSVQFPINSLKKIAFEKAMLPDGLENIEASKYFRFQNGSIVIEGGQPNSLVNIYTIQGTLMHQSRLDGDGNAAIPTNSLRGATFIVTNSGVTFKFMQP